MNEKLGDSLQTLFSENKNKNENFDLQTVLDIAI